eukprot:9792443-Ditylum_brightwellii.AAC.1
MPLHDRMNCSDESKALWLESVHIAVHNFTIVYKCTLQQRVMADFFQCRRQSEDGASSQHNEMTGIEKLQVRTYIQQNNDHLDQELDR